MTTYKPYKKPSIWIFVFFLAVSVAGVKYTGGALNVLCVSSFLFWTYAFFQLIILISADSVYEPVDPMADFKTEDKTMGDVRRAMQTHRRFHNFNAGRNYAGGLLYMGGGLASLNIARAINYSSLMAIVGVLFGLIGLFAIWVAFSAFYRAYKHHRISQRAGKLLVKFAVSMSLDPYLISNKPNPFTTYWDGVKKQVIDAQVEILHSTDLYPDIDDKSPN